MSLNIKNEHTCELAKELAAMTGKSITAAIGEALSEKLDRVRKQHGKKAKAEELLNIGKRCASHIKQPVSSTDHGALLYDDGGMPK